VISQITLIVLHITLVSCQKEEVENSAKYVAYGINQCIPQYNMPSLHAEIAALKNINKKNLPKCVNLVVVRFTKEGNLVSSRPCYNCIRTLSRCINIKYVFYSCDGEIIKEKFNEMLENELTTVSSGARQRKKLQEEHKQLCSKCH
jgi:tRNA(Arg) A34 adenosine deaminase TadA